MLSHERAPDAAPGLPSAHISRLGRAGLALFALHVVLLLVPPVPPYWKGSLPSYVIGYIAILLILRELARQRTRVLDRWDRAARARRWTAAALAVAGTIVGAFALRAAAPDVFIRFSREEGVWEPITLLCFLFSALLLRPRRDGTTAPGAKPWRLAAAFYLVLALEEIDWFGIFGGVIGRVQGIYTGSLHDIIRLVAADVMPAVAGAILVAGALLLITLLWRGGYLDRRWIAARFREPELVWFALGATLIGTGAADDARLAGWIMAPPTPEEALEVAGALCLLVYALELAARRRTPRPGDPGGTPTRTLPDRNRSILRGLAPFARSREREDRDRATA